jgi:protein O-mannosyl-transferase
LRINTSKNHEISEKSFKFFSNDVLLIVLLVLINGVVWQGVRFNGTINLDDPRTVNDPLISELSFDNIRKMIDEYPAEYPVTRISHAVTYQFFGAPTDENIGYWHLMSMFLHLMSTMAVFFLSKKILPHFDIKYIFLIALIWSIHPLKVESVAWITERKDQLYGFFTFAAMLTFISYFQAKNAGDVWQSIGWYGATFTLFILGLGSKGMMVSLPLALMLIDYVMSRKISFTQSAVEKIPFFALALFGGLMAFSAPYSEDQSMDLANVDTIPHWMRIPIASQAIIIYFIKIVLPIDLRIHYQFPHHFFALTLSLLIITAGSIFIFKKRKMLFTQENKIVIFGTVFFLIYIIFVALFPIADTIIAERYTYVASLGITITFVFLAEKLVVKFSMRKQAVGIYIAITVLFSYLTYNQIQIWENGKTVFENQITKAPDDYFGYYWVSNYFNESGKPQQELECLSKGIVAQPENIHHLYQKRIVLLMKQKSFISAQKDILVLLKPENQKRISSKQRVWVHEQMIGACAYRNDPKGMINYCNQLIKIDFHNKLAHESKILALLAINGGNLDSVIEHLDWYARSGGNQDMVRQLRKYAIEKAKPMS